MADNDSGGSTAIVAIVAIIVILIAGYFLFQRYGAGTADTPDANIDVELPVDDGMDGEVTE